MYGQEMRWNLPGRKRKVIAFSDLHFCDKVAKRRARTVLRVLQEVGQAEQIDYFLFLGDLINSLDVLENNKLRGELEDFLRSLAEVAPVLIVTGNHDMSYYTDGATRGVMYPERWYRWARKIDQEERIYVLDEMLGAGKAVFDDGVIRVLGMNLPEVCYPTMVNEKRNPLTVIREEAERVLPELTKVAGREYYLLLHNPQFLAEMALDSRIAVLSGHMHNGLVPPIIDELTRFSHRGLVGPGYYDKKGKKMNYVPFAQGSRYRPKPGRPWLTLNSCTHMPPEGCLWGFDWIFPAVSYAIITGDGTEMKFSSKYFRC